MAQSGSILGNSVLRKEDPGLLTGANRYTDDIVVEGETHIVFVRSTMGHAELRSVDTSEAESMPGVLRVLTAEGLGAGSVPGGAGGGEGMPAAPSAAGATEGIPDLHGFPLLPPTFNRPPLARGRVRFAGDIIAAVVAETWVQGLDAAEAVVVDYEPLPVVTDIEEAMADGAPVIWEDNGSNMCFETALGTESDPLEGADVVVSERIVSQRLAGVPMEPNAFLGVPGGDGTLTAYIASQNPHTVHEALAPMLGVAPDQLRVIAPWVGGGFGPKAGMYVEYVIAGRAALMLGRPVKWTETRSENMVSMVHGRAMVMNASLGLRSDGTIVGLKADVLADTGAYPAIGAFLPVLTQTMSQAVYDIPKVSFHARSVVTNTTTTAAYRGAGRPEATQMVERILDVAADELGMDPAELRRKNFIPPDRFPLTTVTGANYDSGEYEKALDAALEASGYAELRAEQERRRKAEDRKLMGIGVSAYVEVTAPLGLHSEYGACEVRPDGKVVIKAGTSSHGQGHDTAFSMLASDVLGVGFDDIIFVQSDTGEVPRGQGTMGSRSLQTAGSAIQKASQEVLAKARKLAAHLLEASEDDIVLADDGGLQVTGVPTSKLSWSELAQAAADDSRRPDGMDAGLSHEHDFDGGDSTFPFGVHVAVVEVDRDTGGVVLVRHVAVDDCGRILNPMLVNGQQHGGIAQGVAQVLFEWVQYDADGNPVTSNLMDYLMPSAAEFPSFEVSNTETPSPRNPLGAKGIGESGTIGSGPAVHNAIVDAVSHLGVRHIDMPCTPQRIWEALASAR
jgi:aerobic carbon-monoxide dehydrogenase large subunit